MSTSIDDDKNIGNSSSNQNKIFKTAREIREESLDYCIRCVRLKVKPPRKGYPFCQICYDIEMPVHIYKTGYE